MTVTHGDTAMTNDRSDCTARRSADRGGWKVSWLPGQVLGRDVVMRVMIHADTAAELGVTSRLEERSFEAGD